MTTTLTPASAADNADATASHHQKRSRADRTPHEQKRRHAVRRLLLIGIAVWLYLGVALVWLGQNDVAAAAWMVLGAALVPSALVYSETWRLMPRDGLSSRTLVGAAVIGGFVAVTVGGSIDTLTALITTPGALNGIVPLSLSGVVEEAAKIAVVIFIGRKLVKSTRAGLFLGGAVGAGFAAYETLGYIMRYHFNPAFEGGHATLAAAHETFARGLLMLGMHPLWTALLAAAVFAAAKNDRFRITATVVLAYLGVAFAHGLFDSISILLPAAMGPAGDLLSTYVSAGIVSLPLAFVWLHVSRRANAAAAAAGESAPVSA